MIWDLENFQSLEKLPGVYIICISAPAELEQHFMIKQLGLAEWLKW
jgi:hypothetical protein